MKINEKLDIKLVIFHKFKINLEAFKFGFSLVFKDFWRFQVKLYVLKLLKLFDNFRLKSLNFKAFQIFQINLFIFLIFLIFSHKKCAIAFIAF